MDKANVVAVQTNEQKRQSWKAGLAKAGVLGVTALASVPSFAFELQSILDESGAKTNADNTAVFVLGVVIVLFALGMARRGLGK